ncbi:MAG: lysoplasmalogenase [Spirochaetales bacterium]|nr:lysoplasmalogenase [Spirochaetales bacterium]
MAWLLGCFAVVLAANMMFAVRQSQHGDRCTKPLLMPLLILYYVFSANPSNGWVVGALVFGFLGDVFLLGQKEIFFKAGVIAFLLGNVCYAVAFWKVSGGLTQPLLLWLLVPYSVAGGILMLWLWRYLGVQKIPVLIYLLVIFVMSWTSWFSVVAGSRPTAVIGVVGSLLFIFSDVLLTVKVFVKPQKTVQALVMLLYGLAQVSLMGSFLVW